jgi:hypothetical protein
MAPVRRLRSSRVKRHTLGGDDPGVGNIVLVVLAILVLLAGSVTLYLKSRAVTTDVDALTLCPRSRPPSAILGILLDVSDSLTEPQRLEVQNQLARIGQGLPRFGLVELYTVGGLDRPLPRAVLHLCNPGTGQDLNRLYQNPELARRRWVAFEDTVGQALGRQMSSPSYSASPIFEAIQAMALRSFGNPAYDVVPKRLVIVSDLLQNVPGGLNMYDGLPAFGAFKNGAYFARVGADLRGVTVRIYYLVRPGSTIQGRTHAEFWNQYFLAQGATVDTLMKVYGAR